MDGESGAGAALMGAPESDDVGAIRDDLVQRALAALLADAERCEGELAREDINRLYAKRSLRIAECAGSRTSNNRPRLRIAEEPDDDLASDKPANEPGGYFAPRGKRRF